MAKKESNMSSGMFLFSVFITLLNVSAEGWSQNFKKEKICLGGRVLRVEIADSPKTRSKGLMHRKKLKGIDGMLFVFKKERQLSFWMKNTFINLSIGFFDKKRRLVDIQEMQAVKSEMETPKTYKSQKPARYALEMNQGWFKKHQIQKGMKFYRRGQTNVESTCDLDDSPK